MFGIKKSNQERSAASVSVREAETLLQSLRNLETITQGESKIEAQLCERSHRLIGENIKLLDDYVKSCKDSGFCDRNMLNGILVEIEKDWHIDSRASNLHFVQTKDIITLLGEFRANLEGGYEGRFNEVHSTINGLASQSPDSYKMISSRLAAIPQASITQGNVEHNLECTRAERINITQQVSVPLQLVHHLIWQDISDKVDEALRDNAVDPKKASYMMQF